MKIIPAIDVIGGNCVRLSQGQYDSSRKYYDDPLDAAKLFEDAGIGRLHLVDLDGAKASFPANLAVLERIASCTRLEVEFGGGIKSSEALSAVFSAGASYAICGSVAVTAPERLDEWLELYGSKIILGVDCKGGKVATRGWLDGSALTSDDLLGRFPAATQAIVTEIERDGMLSGVNVASYAGLQERFPATDIIVSGGISCAEDLRELSSAGLRGAIVGKAFYEGQITLKELSTLVSGQTKGDMPCV